MVLANEPALTIGALAAAIVAIAGLFHVVIDASTLTVILVAAVPLVSALLTRTRVTPAKGVTK